MRIALEYFINNLYTFKKKPTQILYKLYTLMLKMTSLDCSHDIFLLFVLIKYAKTSCFVPFIKLVS